MPSGQLHEKESSGSKTHVPPFRQGLSVHWSTSQFSPESQESSLVAVVIDMTVGEFNFVVVWIYVVEIEVFIVVVVVLNVDVVLVDVVVWADGSSLVEISVVSVGLIGDTADKRVELEIIKFKLNSNFEP